MMSPKHFSQEVESLLSRAMDAKNSLDSIKAVYALSEKKNKKQVRDALILSLQNPDLDVKMTILEVLCNPHFLDEEILPTMRELIEKEEEEIQVQAVEIIGSIKSEKSADILIEALNDESPRVKYGAMAALANVGHKKASKALENILESREWKDRKHAIDAIGMLANPESKKTMIKGLRDPAPQVREQA